MPPSNVAATVDAPCIITVDEGTPPEVAKALVSRMERFRALIPGWCKEVSVGYDVADQGAAALCQTRYCSRWIHIMAGQQFFNGNENDRDRYVVHELVHGLQAPVQDWGEALIDEHIPEPIRDIVRTTWMQMVECMTADTQRAFSRLLAPPPAE